MRKSVFITGGASGIGAASAAIFAEKGWNVAVYDLQRTSWVDECIAKYGDERFLFFEGDTRDSAALGQAATASVDAFGGLHSVFACAGVHHSDTMLEVDEADLQRIIDINVTGTFRTLRATVPHIIEAGGGAVVINASDQSFIGKRHSFAYGLTKGALGQMTKSLALDLAEKGVRVNAICPGTIRTPMVDAIFERCAARGEGSVAELWAEEEALFPLGRAGRAEEVGRLVYFLGSDEASFSTGGLYPIDGGLTAG